MSVRGKSTAFFTLCLLVTAVSLSAPVAAKMSTVQHQAAKAQLQALMGEDSKDYKKRYSIDSNGTITVVNHSGKRLRGTANNLFVAFNSNNLFMANMVYYGFVWRNNFNIFGSGMIYAKQFRSTAAARNWARLMIKETAKLAGMSGHGDDPLAEQKISYLENEIRNFEAGDSRNRTVRKWYKQVVIPALREANKSRDLKFSCEIICSKMTIKVSINAVSGSKARKIAIKEGDGYCKDMAAGFYKRVIWGGCSQTGW